MEGDEIGIVLARASELRSKITNCVEKATKRGKGIDGEEEEQGGGAGGGDDRGRSVDGGVGEADDDEAESLLNIRDALESLEEQLTSLQALQQQQRYEREATLAEIDYSRKILLEKLKEYKGEDLEVIHEASAFASETVEHNDDLLLPPYPSRPPRPLILGNGSNLPSTRKYPDNGVVSLDRINEARKINEFENKQSQPATKNSPTRLRLILNLAAKTVFTIVSVASILSLTGFEASFRKRSTSWKVSDLFQSSTSEEKRNTIQCPPGKVLVMENGEPRCLVKERVEIPFEPVITTPNVSYGCG